MNAGYQGAPRPRVLAVGLTDAEIEEIRPLAGSLVVTDALRSVHPEEHDVLIQTEADFADFAGHFPRRIVFSEPPAQRDESGRLIVGSIKTDRSVTRRVTRIAPARDFAVQPEAQEMGVESLVRRSCMPTPGEHYAGFKTPVKPFRSEMIFLRELLNDSLAIAGFLEYDSEFPLEDSWYSYDSALWLPDIARSHLGEWTRFAFSRWREADPDAFPENAEWKAADLWASPEESAARLTLREFDEAEARRREAAERERAELAAAVDAAGEKGAHWRSILTDTGDELVASVKGVFDGFGFEVVDSDALPQNKGKKREDLRVSDGDWIALVEVKGYGGGAKSNDLQQVTGASTAFAASEGRAPDSLWYVVNAFREDDPGQRSVALVSRDDDLTSFAENTTAA